jgi:hypothetical protein
VSEAIDDVGVANTIQGDSFVLKVRNERPFQVNLGFTLKEDVQSLDYDRARGTVVSSVVICDINFRVATASKALDNVVPPVESALLKFEFRHYLALIRILRC